MDFGSSCHGSRGCSSRPRTSSHKTNVADFGKELRWNDVYYHMANGL